MVRISIGSMVCPSYLPSCSIITSHLGKKHSPNHNFARNCPDFGGNPNVMLDRQVVVKNFPSSTTIINA